MARIQRSLQTVIDEALLPLPRSSVLVNYTGDGYLLALCNETSASGIAFLGNLELRLSEVLAPYDQTFRIGADFGFVQPSRNAVTKRLEHFAQPGIRASRLQAACGTNEILVTEEVRALFAPLSDGMFGERRTVKVKQHKLIAYPLMSRTSRDDAGLRMSPLELLLRPPELSALAIPADRANILVVEDNVLNRELLAATIRQMGGNVTTAIDGAEAIQLFHATRYSVVITDLDMPVIDGFTLIDHLGSEAGDQPIIVVSGLPGDLGARVSHVPLFRKPLKNYTLAVALHLVGVTPGWESLRRWFAHPASIVTEISEATTVMKTFLEEHGGDDPVDGLLRHKAKEYVHAYAEAIRADHAEVVVARDLRQRLQRLAALGRRIKRAETVGLLPYMQSLATDIAGDHPRLKLNIDVTEEISTAMDNTGLGGAIVLCATELIDNACDATKAQGEISVSLNRRRSEDAVRLLVHNNGPQISRRLERAVFAEGVSTKGSGRGLGLSLVKRLAESLGGDVNLEQDHGVTFIVTLPSDMKPTA